MAARRQCSRAGPRRARAARLAWCSTSSADARARAGRPAGSADSADDRRSRRERNCLGCSPRAGVGARRRGSHRADGLVRRGPGALPTLGRPASGCPRSSAEATMSVTVTRAGWISRNCRPDSMTLTLRAGSAEAELSVEHRPGGVHVAVARPRRGAGLCLAVSRSPAGSAQRGLNPGWSALRGPASISAPRSTAFGRTWHVSRERRWPAASSSSAICQRTRVTGCRWP